MHARVDVTDEARRVIDQLREAHGPLMFHLSGEIHGCSFYISKSQFEHWQDTHLTIDVTPGRGASFSLEIPLGVRFVTKSRLFTEDEKQDLVPVSSGSS